MSTAVSASPQTTSRSLVNLSPRRLFREIRTALQDTNLEADPALTTVEWRGDTCRVVVTCAEPPLDEAHRRIMHSAAHITVMEVLEAAHISIERQEIQIVVKHPTTTDPSEASSARLPPMLASEWIHAQLEARCEWLMIYSRMLANGIYQRVVDAYPWRDRERMEQMLPALVKRSVDSLVQGVPDEAMASGKVDAILPPFEALLVPFDREVVFADVVSHMGRKPQHLLELYEAVFVMAHTYPKVKTQVRRLYDSLFF